MQKLKQIKLENTVQVRVECYPNDQVVVNNFKIIMQCLRALNDGHNELSNRFDLFVERYEAGGNNQQQKYSIKQLNQGQNNHLEEVIRQIAERSLKNQSNILGNIKDLNLINKEIGVIKKEIQGLGKANQSKNIGGHTDLESLGNINREILGNRELMMKMGEEMEGMRREMEKLKELVRKMGDEQDKQDKLLSSLNDRMGNVGSSDSARNRGVNQSEINQLKEGLKSLGKRMSGLEQMNDNLKKQTLILSQGQQTLDDICENLTEEINKLKEEFSNMINSGKDNQQSNSSTNLKADIDLQVKQLKSELKELRNEIQDLKRQQCNSKTSLDDERKSAKLFDKAGYTQSRFKDDDKYKDLIIRMEYLQKLCGSKSSLGDKLDSQDKLPLIKRGRGIKQRESSSHHEKSASKKNLAEIKADLQNWANSYLSEMKGKDNSQEVELKLQEIRNNLNRKADQEGLKKGLGFLENKINQLYLFLTEPEGDDAMIVRKGFNCLSCSKKVEKLRGKIGPHINWNTLTNVNYSPPKVGYTRHANQNSGQKQEEI